MKQLFQFMLKVPSIDGTLVEDLIQKQLANGHATHAVYTLKKGAGKLYRQLHLYKEQNLLQIKQICRPHLYYFDFVKHSDPNQVYGTQGFEFADNETTQEDKDSFAGYKL